MMPKHYVPLSISMRSIVRFLLWIFVFTQPWDTIAWEGIGALSRLVGVATLGAAVFTIAIEGRVRKPNAIFWIAAVFVTDLALSQLWTISPEASATRTWTYVQLLGSVWVIQEFARTREELRSLLVAFCLGAFIPTASILNNFRLGIRGVSGVAERYSSGGALYINADNVALILVIAIPIAMYLIRHGGWGVRLTGIIYLVLGTVAILLTATRTAFLAGVVAISIAPLIHAGQFLRSSLRARVVLQATALMVIVIVTSTLVVPRSVWSRLATIQTEIAEGGRMSGRSDIWRQGIQLFLERPLLGHGAGTFEEAIVKFHGATESAHNLPLQVLAEQGILGLVIFMALIGACPYAISRVPLAERKLWTSVMLAWLVGVMTINFGGSKVTWLLFGLLAAQTVQKSERHVSAVVAQKRTYVAMRPRFQHPVRSQQVARTSRG